MDTILFVLRIIAGTISGIMIICISIIWTIIGYPLLWLCSWIFVFCDARQREKFTRSLQVTDKKHVKFAGIYNVYVEYRGKQYCFNDEKLYKSKKIGDEVLTKICIDGKGNVESVNIVK